jgi:hypothetical protein
VRPPRRPADHPYRWMDRLAGHCMRRTVTDPGRTRAPWWVARRVDRTIGGRVDDGDSGSGGAGRGGPGGDPLPLPRRDGRTHLEPRLREPDGAETGTPFAAFDPDPDPDQNPDPDVAAGRAIAPDAADPGAENTGDDRPRPGDRVAAFRAAVRRATRRH